MQAAHGPLPFLEAGPRPVDADESEVAQCGDSSVNGSGLPLAARMNPFIGGVEGAGSKVFQNDTVVVMDMVRGAPSHAAFSVIADRYGVSSRLFTTIENSVDRNRSLSASPLKLT